MKNDDVYQAPRADLSNNASNVDIQNILLVAKRQKELLFTFLVYFLVAGFSNSVSPEVKPLIQILILPLMLAVVIFTARLVLRLYGKPGAIIMLVLSIIPLINLLVLLAANSRANGVIKGAGFRVGLFGANVKEIESSID